jgi:hypothetical protein
VFALVMAACGGGSSSEDSALTKKAFIKQADAICKKSDEKQIEVLNTLGPKASEQSVRMGALDVTQEEAEEIAALGAPSGEEEQVAAIASGIEEAVAEARKVPIPQYAEPFTEVDKISKAYGMKQCSEAL